MTTAYIRHPDLRMTDVDGEGVVLHLGSRQYFSVNQTGITVLEQLRTHRTVGELVAVVTAEYDVSEADAEHTIRAFIERCVESDLLSEFR